MKLIMAGVKAEREVGFRVIGSGRVQIGFTQKL
jgi:hypothetical protein